MIGLTVLGSTGSIGLSTLDVVARHPNRYKVIALTANTDVLSMFKQCQNFQPLTVVMVNDNSAEQLAIKLKQHGLSHIQVNSGQEALCDVAKRADVDYVMAAIVGAAGLLSALAAVTAGKRVLLANKEALVMSGALFMQAAKDSGAVLLPIDSEHNAIFQCMPRHFEQGLDGVGVSKILLTASGGPFLHKSLADIQHVTPDEACAHPNWDMGRKISVDSATMMNKGLEVIEACWLFNTAASQIQVVVHPQSVIHSMVQYTDGSVLAQLGNPDMRTPIAHAMAWPERIESGVKALDLFEIAQLDFEKPDFQRFPCLGLAYQAIEAGGSLPTVLNAANEVAVASFLEGRLGFSEIPTVIEKTLETVGSSEVNCLADLLNIDENARLMANRAI